MLLAHRDAVLFRAAAHYAEDTLSAWAAGATPERVERLERQIADPDLVVLVAEAGGEIVGYVMAAPYKNELRAVYVRPNPIGHVGRALLAEVEKQALNAGTEFLACHASLNAEAFYTINGYTAEGRGQHRMRSGDLMDCVFMRKKLDRQAPAHLERRPV
jgi:predicted N-acetyltransferase YhbS